MHRTQSHRSKGRNLKRKKRFMSSVKGVSHLSRQAKRRLYCKLQLWMWRKQREKFRFGIFRTKKRACGISSGSCHSLKAQSQKNKKKVLMQHMLNLKISQARSLAVASPLGCATKSSEDALNQKRPQGSVSLSETSTDSSSLQNQVTNTTVTADTVIQTVSSQKTETVGHFSDGSNPSNRCHTVKPLLSTDSGPCGGFTRPKAPRTMMPPQRFEVSCPSGQQPTVIPGQHQALSRDTDESFTSKMSSQSDLSIKALTKNIHDFLSDFYRRYGSFIPLQKSDVLRHLKGKFNTDFNDRKTIIFSEIAKSRTVIVQKPISCFQVIYKKHTLTLEDLSTLADQNWLNDQVMNMYGELIVESSHHKVHFLNSFFHRQLMTKGYDGVKRWTKQVDLFSKTLLLVPIHLEVHWCLVTADLVKKKVCLYDSQGIALQKVARNILKYLMTEAKEKKQAAFENGWAVSLDEQKIPQQTNENDCGVFVLEYSRCLALAKPLQFSQEDIPKIRKRIYKELCDCRLHDER